MFTGLVRSVGTVERVSPGAQSRIFTIAAALSEGDRALGASVAVSGVCLTVIAATPRDFTVEAAFETLAVTTLGALRAGARVNLEPALRLGDALGGHLVSGHVDGVARLRSRTRRGEALEVWFDAPGDLLPFVAVKGSVCVDGVSLTVNAQDERGFAVGLIPHTLAATTLGEREAGDALNLEVDLLARHVARLLQFVTASRPEFVTASRPEFVTASRPEGASRPELTSEALRRAGFPGAEDRTRAPGPNDPVPEDKP